MQNDIQSVRYELPMQAPRGFMSYAADAAQAYYKKKKEVEDAKRAEMLAVFPTLAAHGGVRKPNAGESPDTMVGGVPWMTSTPTPQGTQPVPPLAGYEETPGIKDWNDVRAMYGAKEAEAWAEGRPSNQMITKEAIGSIYATGKSPEEKFKEAQFLIQKMKRTPGNGSVSVRLKTGSRKGEVIGMEKDKAADLITRYPDIYEAVK
jgi:hypothetical protein